MDKPFPAVVLAGICLTGKTTLARALEEGGLPVHDIVEGDDLHTATAIRKMRFGEPLCNADREDWKRRICSRISERPRGSYRLIACSALGKTFRDDLRKRGDVRFVFLVFGRESAEQRAMKRLRDTWQQIHGSPGGEPHFFQPAIYPRLLDGQYRDLEVPGPGEDDCIVFDLDTYPKGEYGPEVDYGELARRISAWLRNPAPGSD